MTTSTGSEEDEPQPSRQPRAGERLTVVLAEDDEELRWALATLLREDGHQVIEVSDGGRLLEGMLGGEFEGVAIGENLLLVADMFMPHTDALTVIRKLTKRGRGPRFVLMTAFADPAVQAEADALGALAVFDKPFAFEELRALIDGMDGRFTVQ